MTTRVKRLTARVTRNGILFVAGLSGIGYETIFARADRPTLLVLFGAMVGLPAFLAVDESRKREPKLEPKPEPEPEKVTV